LFSFAKQASRQAMTPHISFIFEVNEIFWGLEIEGCSRFLSDVHNKKSLLVTILLNNNLPFERADFEKQAQEEEEAARMKENYYRLRNIEEPIWIVTYVWCCCCCLLRTAGDRIAF